MCHKNIDLRRIPLGRTGWPEWLVCKWSVPFFMVRIYKFLEISESEKCNTSDILKKFKELALNQAFKLENSILKLTGLADQF